jgi:GrpB-like predicted nucleotidyltransferase (UPF0157 family)
MKTLISPYNPQWPLVFADEKQKLSGILKELEPSIEHIGSTAIPGLGAKPIIDILIGVKNESELEKTLIPMQQSGYTYFRIFEPLMPYRRYFVKLKALAGKPIPELIDKDDDFFRGKDFDSLAHIHIIQKDTIHWKRHIAFRNYLKAHKSERNDYHKLKLELSNKTLKEEIDYNDAKSSFINQKEALALEWFRG